MNFLFVRYDAMIVIILPAIARTDISMYERARRMESEWNV